MSKLRIAVIGAGHMGSLHAEKVAALEEIDGSVTLAGVADLIVDRARSVAKTVTCPRVSNHRELLLFSDAAIVAVPTTSHASIVGDCLDAGLDVLVEKPIALATSEADELLRQAQDQGLLIQVGHVEWFNAAMRAVASRIVNPRFVECHRLGPFSDRATDIDVVRDLMIHDIDITQRLLGEEPEHIESIGMALLTNQIDLANARLNFPGGCVGNFTASRVSPKPMRKIRFFQRDGYFSIDFLEQSVVIARPVLGSGLGEKRIDLERLEIDHSDALVEQLRAFVEGVRARRLSAGSGSDAVAALRTAFRVISAMPTIEELS